jgi:histidine triad (HIT) family protein
VSDQITLFDKIKAKEVPADIVYEDEQVLAFRDINPQAPVHVLVIPQHKLKGFANFVNSTDAEVGAFLRGVAKVAHTLGLDGEGYRIVFNQGKHGQQTVHYIHAHILGGRQMKWPPG